MAHVQQQAFVAEVKSLFPEFFEGTKVLEVGSWICNDTVRKHFRACDYIGADVAAGAGVDLAVPGQNLALPSESFDVVISCECFEHNPFWLETFLNMARMLRPGGLFILTCATVGRGEHGTARTSREASLTALEGHCDYYRNLTRRDFEARISLQNHFSDFLFVTNRYSKDLYFAGCKRDAVPNSNLKAKIESVRRAARRINEGRKVHAGRALAANMEWWAKWSLERALGETNYHNLRYVLGRR
jgi:SAM-dependent methyltransferase